MRFQDLDKKGINLICFVKLSGDTYFSSMRNPSWDNSWKDIYTEEDLNEAMVSLNWHKLMDREDVIMWGHPDLDALRRRMLTESI